MSDEDQVMVSEEDFSKSADEFSHPLDPLPSTSSNLYSQYSFSECENLSPPNLSSAAYSNFLTTTPYSTHCSASFYQLHGLSTTALPGTTLSVPEHLIAVPNSVSRHRTAATTTNGSSFSVVGCDSGNAGAAVDVGGDDGGGGGSGDGGGGGGASGGLSAIGFGNVGVSSNCNGVNSGNSNGICDIPTVQQQQQQQQQQHVFASTIMPSEFIGGNSAIWDQWLCCLATSLTPAQWQTYWTNYLALFGTSALPAHIVNFFNTAAQIHLQQQKLWMDERQRYYG
ncbi:unnamed protein product [Enterobius vermicularis]|uniref:Uncharacterized protein n=1 Tax=Enterobius vermicularis TaxID=51028 RepID=A0A0N4V7E7_ENTVE|nr:unnamed protein product [Enterobius vermicularis]